MNTCEVCKLLPTIKAEYILIDGQHWSANLGMQDQTLLGRTYITAKRHVYELDQLSTEEEFEFIDIRNRLIGALRMAYNPITFNTSCLKNDTFIEDPNNALTEEAHVHWHLMPRYSRETQEVNGELFTDPQPGKYIQPSLYTRHIPSEATARLIAEQIRSHL